MRYFFFLIFSSIVLAQGKIVNEDFHLWTSINSMMRFSEKWGAMLDMHHRRSDGGNLPSFSLIRTGVNYHVDKHLSLNAGFSVMQLNTPFSIHSSSMEYRPHIQALYNQNLAGIRMISRMRIESRWRENPATDSYFHQLRYRYLLNLTIPVFKNEYIPQFVIADEIFLQSGEKTTLNPFDQNRIFLGIRQKLTKDFSFDLGYMNVYQQQSSGNIFNTFHTLRLFFYWTPDFRKRKQDIHQPIHSD